jgi:hypothetical protein
LAVFEGTRNDAGCGDAATGIIIGSSTDELWFVFGRRGIDDALFRGDAVPHDETRLVRDLFSRALLASAGY